MATTDAVQIVEWDVESGETGNVEAVVTVRNSGEAAETRTVWARVTAGDDSQKRTEEVEVGPGVTKEVRLSYDLKYKRFRKRGELTTELR